MNKKKVLNGFFIGVTVLVATYIIIGLFAEKNVYAEEIRSLIDTNLLIIEALWSGFMGICFNLVGELYKSIPERKNKKTVVVSLIILLMVLAIAIYVTAKGNMIYPTEYVEDTFYGVLLTYFLIKIVITMIMLKAEEKSINRKIIERNS